MCRRPPTPSVGPAQSPLEDGQDGAATEEGPSQAEPSPPAPPPAAPEQPAETQEKPTGQFQLQDAKGDITFYPRTIPGVQQMIAAIGTAIDMGMPELWQLNRGLMERIAEREPSVRDDIQKLADAVALGVSATATAEDGAGLADA